jgi:hypothetical protein
VDGCGSCVDDNLCNSYIEQLSLILQTLGKPDDETLARIGSEKVSFTASEK